MGSDTTIPPVQTKSEVLYFFLPFLEKKNHKKCAVFYFYLWLFPVLGSKTTYSQEIARLKTLLMDQKGPNYFLKIRYL